MYRNESAGLMSAPAGSGGGGGGSAFADRVVPNRVRCVLWDPMVSDEHINKFVMQCGEVKHMYRPPNNPWWVFVQYVEARCAELAILKLKSLPLFRAVDPALKSERFVNEKSGGSNSNNNDDQQQRGSGMKNQFNKSSNNRQQKGGDNGNKNNTNNNMNGHGIGSLDLASNFRASRNDSFNDKSYTSMESSSPQKPPAQTDIYQPKSSLGCWCCTKLPSFECRCGAFYCDIECQRIDWPVHKDICLPRMVPISYNNKRMLQEAAASKQSPSPQDSQPQQQNQNRRGQEATASKQSSSQPQHNQNRRGQDAAAFKQSSSSFSPTNPKIRGQTSIKDNQGTKVDSPRQQQSKPTNDQQTPKSLPAEADNVSRVSNKLQRLKIAKSMNGAATVTRGVLQPGVFPREGSMVKITASLNSGVVYIYHNNGKDGQQSDYYLLTNRFFKAAADAKPLKEVPPVDDVIFAPFLGGYYRAKVLAVNGEKLEVFFVDFGNSDKVEWKQSKEIADSELKWAKYLTYPVRVEGVETFSVEMIKLLETLEHEVDFDLVKVDPVQGSELKSVVLKRPKQSLTLNMELMELKEREFRLKKEREERKEQERLDKEREKKQEQERKVNKVEVKIADPSNYEPLLFDISMETKQLPLGGIKRLLIIDASEVLETRIISVVSFEDVEKYGSVLEQCGLAGMADSNVYKPTEEGEVCLVLYQEDWSRALYDISDGSFMLLDVGIIASVAAANVRRFPPQLSRVVYNNEVFVENLPKLKGMMKDGKPDTVHGHAIDAKIAASEEGVSISIVDASAGDS